MSSFDEDFDAEASDERDIAIIGLAGRFPGAKNLDQFWDNLQAGREGVTFWSDEELRAAGVDEALLRDPHYVKAGTVLDDVEYFDAPFFGYNPREAEILDPQQRFFLECAWSALENAGYVPERYDGVIGVYAGVAWNTYLLSNLTAHPELFAGGGAFQVFITNDKDFMPTRTSYKLNLKGPSLIIQTSCSTSLVATHMACLSLLDYECDMALVGGVTIKVPQQAGYFYQEEGIASPDGHCRAFDAQAAGTIFGSGAGVVVLKRLANARADGDTIHAVIKGSAINNDGSLKVSYTAPSVEGQAEVIAQAQAVAQIDPATIGYIEAHGTGTALGDPIEVAALTKVFRTATDQRQFCALGTVKSNIGHLDAAAGIAGLIKTVLTLKHAQIPPSLHYSTPNPKIDFDNSPFYVNTKLTPWPAGATPRRAGVSSFGVGGTNAHVIVEEAPAPAPAATPSRAAQLLVFSARSETALEAQTEQLANYFAQSPAALADVAYTLQTGRRIFAQRRMLIAEDAAEAARILASRDPERLWGTSEEAVDRPVAWMFSGQGAQYVGMGHGLYQSEPVFRATVDRCAAVLQPLLGLDLRTVVFAAGDQTEASAQLQQTALAQPALFMIEYALAQLWQSWGIVPAALIGHSIGEYVAACLAGVFSLEDALTLVATRGKLMQQMPAGSMLAVTLPEADLLGLLTPELSLAAVNGPQQCVVAGPSQAIAALAATLQARGINHRPLHTSHAFHSAMMEPMLAEFGAAVARVKLQEPQQKVISNVSGTWLTAAEATEPAYWTRHLRQPVRFAAGITTLLADGNPILLEVGPGTTLSTLARQQPAQPEAVASLRHPQDQANDVDVLLTVAGKLWLGGATIDWAKLHAETARQRVPLPTYAFDRLRYWIDATPRPATTPIAAPTIGKHADPTRWLYVPGWKRTPLVPSTSAAPARWLVFAAPDTFGSTLTTALAANAEVIKVEAGTTFSQLSPTHYTVDPAQPADYAALVAALKNAGGVPERIVHAWGVTPSSAEGDHSALIAVQQQGFESLLGLARALAHHEITQPMQLDVLTSGLHSLAGETTIEPAKALVLGPVKVIPQEFPQIACRSIDLAAAIEPSARLVQQLIAELHTTASDPVVAYRQAQRWVQTWENVPLPAAEHSVLRQHGVYMITGGVQGAGLALVEHLAERYAARLVLVAAEPFPSGPEWNAWLAAHPNDDATSAIISRLQGWISRGAQIEVLQAAPDGDLRSAIAHAVNHFGALHGVIHAAGLADSLTFAAIEETSAATVGEHFGPKVTGVLKLAEAISDHTLDFCVLVSSLVSVLGGRGYAAFTAANGFLDAFAQAQQGATPWLSIDWDAWQFGGIETLPPELAQLALTNAEASEVFERVLAHAPGAQVAVSTADLASRIAQGERNRAAAQGQAERRANAVLHPRPKLPNAYVAPDSELERTLAAIWQRMLGIEPIGIYDNFFDLGGDSLTAIQVVGQIKKELEVEIAAVKLYQSLTIKALAELLAEDAGAAAQRRAAQLADRKEHMDRRKQFQEMRRARK